MAKEKPFITLGQYCKAKEVCQSIKDCLFDEPCCKMSSRNVKEPNVYVAKILEDMNQIDSPEADHSYVSNTLQNQSDFQCTIESLNEQFQRIIEQNPCAAVTSQRSDYIPETSSCTVHSLACQIDNILAGSAVEHTDGANSINSSTNLSMLASEINAIINSEYTKPENGFVTLDLAEEVKKLNLCSNAASKLPNPTRATSLQNSAISKQSESSIEMEIPMSANTLEKEDGDFAYLESITGSTTLKDLNSTLLGIIES